MHIGGLQKFSLIDYPGKLCAVVFTQGCNFTCGYCHNPELVYPERFTTGIAESTVLKFLRGRRGRLDAVTVTGGEPLLQQDLPDFLARVKSMGFLAKIDTNGSLPSMLTGLIQRGVVDCIAMDIKAPLAKYEAVTHHPSCGDAVTESIRIIRESLLPHEFRTTVVRNFHTIDDIVAIGHLIRGADRYVLQKCVPPRASAPHADGGGTFTDEEFRVAVRHLAPLVRSIHLR